MVSDARTIKYFIPTLRLIGDLKVATAFNMADVLVGAASAVSADSRSGKESSESELAWEITIRTAEVKSWPPLVSRIETVICWAGEPTFVKANLTDCKGRSLGAVNV